MVMWKENSGKKSDVISNSSEVELLSVIIGKLEGAVKSKGGDIDGDSQDPFQSNERKNIYQMKNK